MAVTRSGGPTAVEPFAGGREFRLQRQIHEVAGNSDMVGRLRLHIVDQRVEHLAALIGMAVARPVDVAQRPLAGELAQPRLQQMVECADPERCASVNSAIRCAIASLFACC